MYVLSDGKWQSGYLPYYLHPDQVRIEVRSWVALREITDAFITYPKDWRRVFDYVRMRGLFPTLRKVISRNREKTRNEKFVSFGWGVVLKSASADFVTEQTPVCFVAPFHPRCVNEVCLHRDLVRQYPTPPGKFNSPNQVFYARHADASCKDLSNVAGWTEWSGRPLDVHAIARVMDQLNPLLTDKSPLNWTELPVEGKQEMPIAVDHSDSKRLRAVIFGMGQYAKVGLAPRIRRYMDITAWHEIDPTQIGTVRPRDCEFRTSMYPESDERHDVYFVAGFHHTHVPVAIHGLAQGAAVVLEKPVATNQQQLGQLLDSMSRSKGRVFVGFQKRYSPLNRLLMEDLRINEQTPVSVRCIVYEIPLPENHWYLWPNSGGRVASNGCHWIDYFLFLNRFCAPIRIEAIPLANGDVSVAIDLENGASCTIVLTDHGSARRGTREIVHVTVGNRTAVIRDDSIYDAECNQRLLRRKRVGRESSFNAMYPAICRKVVHGQAGDSQESIAVSTHAVLEAERQLSGG